MTMLMTNATANYDGSGAPASATGPVVVTFSGTVGASGRTPVITMYSRSDAADFAPEPLKIPLNRRARINLASGDDYYFTVTGVDSDASIDLSVVDA